ncbi:TetR/AcrR family transcriptional regulator [Caulobacter sp. 17J65-9]|uniref:TetR/AcrR family transcriptional regulator n=1 Tax=Caulobacter sp. 17J65-9 TaxID=2709382 RepID=UPI003204C96B
MSVADGPKWRRRKEARPGEIVAAAFAVFAEKGFAAARLDEIAARAGVSKGALYLYFETKEELFHAVVRDAVAPNVAQVRAAAEAFEGPFAQLVRALLPMMAARIVESGAGKVVKMVIGESRNFPALAQHWHDEVVAPTLGVLSGLIERAQARGEVRPGDPRVHAFSLVGPLMLGVLWREVLEPVGGAPVDLQALAAQHVETVLGGLLAREGGAA